MIKVYFLRQLKDIVNNVEYTEGQDYISHAISETTEDPAIRRVIIEEKPELDAIAISTEAPSLRDIANYNTLPPPRPPARNLEAEIDAMRAQVANHEARLKLDVGGHIR